MKKPSKDVQDYWEKLLQDHGLGLSRADGTSKAEDGRRRVLYTGDLNDLEVIIKRESARQTGRKRPSGKGPQ